MGYAKTCDRESVKMGDASWKNELLSWKNELFHRNVFGKYAKCYSLQGIFVNRYDKQSCLKRLYFSRAILTLRQRF